MKGPKTPRAAEPVLETLRLALEKASRSLPLVTQRKMFGCEAFFAKNNIFALVWKTGRIGLKLPKSELYAELMSKKGAAPWTAGDRTMADWVLVPESFHNRQDLLGEWVEAAHDVASKSHGPKSKKKA